jgi:hypothetical protein
VATDNFTITTETAPNTTHFQGKQLKAAAAAAAARAAAARARAAGADAAAVSAAAEAAAAAVAAAGASAAAPPTISEEDDEDYEIEFSEDGQVRARGRDSAVTALSAPSMAAICRSAALDTERKSGRTQPTDRFP